MTIYWEQCNVCGRYHTTRQCTLNRDVMVCIHCCLACPLRDKCPRPAWSFRIEKAVVAKRVSEEKQKIMEELLSKLESRNS